ncbi:hypothetical protein CLV35_2731 [Motilibacter peucedani]|uniref:Uncharacterized protein n=1 Tax=Motilibacter peucedani TaxID=598650 RepID=A0A420XMF1_9ACTN|nr:hypothetical protein [Motilibacter peucedani]RKS72487.1 hypothetical protein CLV35_2731 [Motilibacter peucedani]
MTTLPPEQPAAGAMEALRTAQDRSFGSVGVPMVLALVPAGGDGPVVHDEHVLREGAELARRLGEVRAELFPSQRDGDLGCLISTVQALTVTSFEPGDR